LCTSFRDKKLSVSFVRFSCAPLQLDSYPESILHNPHALQGFDPITYHHVWYLKSQINSRKIRLFAIFCQLQFHITSTFEFLKITSSILEPVSVKCSSNNSTNRHFLYELLQRNVWVFLKHWHPTPLNTFPEAG
jgi:hypothetical protein